jgi:8-oxo-dGTP diphosphatase
MVVRDVAVGFLYHAESCKVLLHLRDVDKPPEAGRWAFFGGRAEPEDGDDLLATWCREMHEELGVTLDPGRTVSLRYGTYDGGTRWHEFYAPWPSLDDSFVLTEGQRYAWFTLDEARALSESELAAYARESLMLFQERLGDRQNVIGMLERGENVGEEPIARSIPEFGERVSGQEYVARPGAYAIIADGTGKIAVIRIGDRYFLPGGGSEHRESPEETVRREIAEECGLTIDAVRWLGVADQYIYAVEERTYFHKQCTFFATTALGAERGPTEDGCELVWLAPTDAEAALAHPSQVWAVRQFRASALAQG